MVSLCMTLVKGLILVRMMILLALFLDGMQDFHRLAQAEDEQQQHQRSGTSRFYPLEEHAISLAQRLCSGPLDPHEVVVVGQGAGDLDELVK